MQILMRRDLGQWSAQSIRRKQVHTVGGAVEIRKAYRHLFEHMPTSLLFDRILFVHGGIPRGHVRRSASAISRASTMRSLARDDVE